MNTAQKLNDLRQLMQQHDIDYYYVPTCDAHNDEYPPAAWARREWLTGFDGSAGDALVGLEQAILWADGRYTLQAKQQLDSSLFKLLEKGQTQATPLATWLQQNKIDKTLGVDARTINMHEAAQLNQVLKRHGGQLKIIDNNLVDNVWADQPPLAHKPLMIFDDKLAGRSVSDKLRMIREQLDNHDCDAYVTSVLDEIAWLLNIRGTDIAFNPLVLSYALVTKDQAMLFINEQSLDEQTRAALQTRQIDLYAYDDFASTLAQQTGAVLVDPRSASYWIELNLNNAHIVTQPSLIALPKAIKNAVELQGMINAHQRDAVAMIEQLQWLQNNWQAQTEYSAAMHLDHLRAKQKNNRGLSFPTISGYADNGAVIHYHVHEDSAKALGDQSLYLFDSGGQYLDGTTDVTRTIHLGAPTAQQKLHYTLVLKGHLALRHCTFPPGTPGGQLDGLVRNPLWSQHLDFAHRTGHGVGHYLCVHEGPQAIGKGSNVPLQVGMIVSNEPGFYLEKHYGIRIENLIYVKRCDDNSGFLGFADLTLVPYCRELLDLNLLNKQEIHWINEYHQLIYDTIGAHLSDNARAWLQQATAALEA